MTRKILLTFLFLLIALTGLWADNALLTDPHEILERMEEAMDFETAKFSAILESTDVLGTTSTTFDTWEKDGDTLLLVTEGPDRGQKILRLEDSIFIYYPSAEEIIRLSSSGLKNSFLGSDFSYEDLTGDDDYDDRYNSTITGTTEYEGRLCYDILLKAKKTSETYQVERVLIDAELFIPLKFELSSKSGKLLKTMYYTDWIVDNGIYFPGKILVANNVKKTNSSQVTITDIVFNLPIDDGLFSKEDLAW